MWNRLTTKQRCRIVASVASELCDHSQDLIQSCTSDQRIDPVETVASELLPLCAALKFIGRRGPKVLTSRSVGSLGRPIWLMGSRSVVARVPLGNVLVLGTWNYSLLLPGVQVAQALAAGNQVQLKPAAGAEQTSRILVECFHLAGVPRRQIVLLDSGTSAATSAIEQGVDLIVLTGAAETGRAVLQVSAPTLPASIMELSGCDAVVVLPGSDLDRLTAALRFGLRSNGGATCIGPRRLFVRSSERQPLIDQLTSMLADEPAVIVHPAAREGVADHITAALESGSKDLLGRYSDGNLCRHGQLHPLLLDQVTEKQAIASADIFAPVLSIITVDDIDHAVRLVNECPYRLAASVFGPTRDAKSIAGRLEVGTVTINDLIVPTADPRLPFGGRGQSGFGVTRGAEGLIAMTAVKVVCTRYGSLMPHLRPRTDSDQQRLLGLLQMTHGRSFGKRIAGLRQMLSGVKKE